MMTVKRALSGMLLILCSAAALVFSSSWDKNASVVYDEAATHANTSTVVYVGQVDSADACFDAASNRIENATAFTFFDPTRGDENPHIAAATEDSAGRG